MADPLLKKLALAGVALAVVVVVLGAFTRLVDAGLGCPDWPGCYGHLLWPNDAVEIEKAEQAFPDTPVDLDKTWPEMVHRYFAGALLLLVFTMTLLTFRREEARPHRNLVTSLLILIICQAAFGAWTVTLKLWPQVVTAHLLGGFATLSLLWIVALRNGAWSALSLNSGDRARLRAISLFALVVVVLQIALGGWVSSNYAALACTDFPTCFGTYSPPMDMAAGFDIFQDVGPNYLGGLLSSDARVAIHWTHRLGALIASAVVLFLAFRLFAVHRALAVALVAVLGTQVLLGSLNVIWALPLWVATAHNAVGALLLLVIVTVNFAPPAGAPELKRGS